MSKPISIFVIAKSGAMWGAGKHFNSEPRKLTVVDAPANDDQITPAQLAELKASMFFTVMDAAPAASEGTAALEKALADALADNAALKAQLADASATKAKS